MWLNAPREKDVRNNLIGERSVRELKLWDQTETTERGISHNKRIAFLNLKLTEEMNLYGN